MNVVDPLYSLKSLIRIFKFILNEFDSFENQFDDAIDVALQCNHITIETAQKLRKLYLCRHTYDPYVAAETLKDILEKLDDK